MSSKKRAAPKPPQQSAPDKIANDDSQGPDSAKKEEQLVLLKILMPDQSVNELEIPLGTPLMDLRMQLCAKYKLSPSSYNIEPIQLEDGAVIPHKPSNTIGSISAKAVAIKSKAKEPVKVSAPKVVEKTVRLTIKMSRSSQQILRVSPNKPLSELMPQIVEKSGILPENHPFLEVRHPQQKAMALETSRTLNDYKINEIYLADKRVPIEIQNELQPSSVIRHETPHVAVYEDKEPIAKSRTGSKKGKSIIKKFWPSKKHKNAPARDTNGSSKSSAVQSPTPDALVKDTNPQEIANANENNSNNKEDHKKKRAAPEKPLPGNNDSLHGQVPGNIPDVTKAESPEQSSLKDEDEKEVDKNSESISPPPRPKAPPRVKAKAPLPVSRPHATGKKRAPLPPTMKAGDEDPPSPRPRPNKPPRTMSAEASSPEDETTKTALAQEESDQKQSQVTEEASEEGAEEVDYPHPQDFPAEVVAVNEEAEKLALSTLQDSPEIDETQEEMHEEVTPINPQDSSIESAKPHEEIAEEMGTPVLQDSPVEIESSTQAYSESEEAIQTSHSDAIETPPSPEEIAFTPPLSLEDVPITLAEQGELVEEKISEFTDTNEQEEKLTETLSERDEGAVKEAAYSSDSEEEKIENISPAQEDVSQDEGYVLENAADEIQSDEEQAFPDIPPPPEVLEDEILSEEVQMSEDDELGMPGETLENLEEANLDMEMKTEVPALDHDEMIVDSKEEMLKPRANFHGELLAAIAQDESEEIGYRKKSESEYSDDSNRITDPAFVQPEFIPDNIAVNTSYYDPNFGQEAPKNEFDFMSRESYEDANSVNESVVTGSGETIKITEKTAYSQEYYNPATQQAVDTGVLGDQDSDSESEMNKNATAQEIERLRAQINRMRRKKAAKAAAEQAQKQKPFTIVTASGNLPKSGKTFTFVPNQSKKQVYEDYKEAPSIGIDLSKNGEIRRSGVRSESYNTSESDDNEKVEAAIPSPPIVAEKKPKPATYEPEKLLIKKVEPPVVVVEKKQESLYQKKAPGNYVSSAAVRKTDSTAKPYVPNVRTSADDENIRKSALPNYYKRFLGTAAMKDAEEGKSHAKGVKRDDNTSTNSEKKKEILAINQINHLPPSGPKKLQDDNNSHPDVVQAKVNNPLSAHSYFSNGHVGKTPVNLPPPLEENHKVDESALPPPPAEFLTPPVKPLDIPAYSPSESPASPMSPDSDASSPRVRSPLSSNFYGLSSAKPFSPTSRMSAPKFRPMSASFKDDDNLLYPDYRTNGKEVNNNRSQMGK